MKVIEIEVRVGRTKNVGNYESSRLDYSYRIQLEEGDSVVEVRQRTLEHLKNEVAKDVEKIHE